MKDYTQMTVGEIVADNFGNAAVFDRYGIDFCCNGARSLPDACLAAEVDREQVVADLTTVTSRESVFADFKSWDTDLLADYILKYHHRNIRTQGPAIDRLLTKVCNVHGDKHPELFKVQALFLGSLADLESHLEKEEVMLFPYIYELCDAERTHGHVGGFHCGTVEAPIRVMMAEHDAEGERYREISRLLNSYFAPENACASYHLLLKHLKAFEQALHHHIHLENNIVFPRAIALEAKLKA